MVLARPGTTWKVDLGCYEESMVANQPMVWSRLSHLNPSLSSTALQVRYDVAHNAIARLFACLI